MIWLGLALHHFQKNWLFKTWKLCFVIVFKQIIISAFGSTSAVSTKCQLLPAGCYQSFAPGQLLCGHLAVLAGQLCTILFSKICFTWLWLSSGILWNWPSFGQHLTFLEHANFKKFTIATFYITYQAGKVEGKKNWGKEGSFILRTFKEDGFASIKAQNLGCQAVNWCHYVIYCVDYET